MKKSILVFGATGNQGGAVVKALAKTDFHIKAVTRNPTEPKAQALAKQGIELIKADMSDEEGIACAMQGVHGVYSVQNSMKGGVQLEEEHGKTLANLAKRAGVQHFVYSSVGGAERKTGIAHFDSKFRIEEHIRSLGIPHSIIRPVFFMENFLEVPSFLLFSIFRNTLQTKTLQMIATEDIGKWVAQVFSKPESYMNKNIEIAGDDLDYRAMQKTWHQNKGKEQLCVPMPAFAISMMGELGRMFLWFRDAGYIADLQECRRQIPDTLNFDQWLAKQKR